jgi:putative transposase
VNLLRQVEVGVANGKTLPQGVQRAEIVEQTYYRSRKEYGGLKVDQARRLKELEHENARLKRLVSELSLEKLVKLLSPERRRCAVIHARATYGMSERLACRVAKQPRGTQRYRPTQREDEDTLAQAIITLASQYGRLWIPPDHGVAQADRLAGWQGPGRADLPS